MEIASNEVFHRRPPMRLSGTPAREGAVDVADQQRRRRPRIVDADWLVMRGLSRMVDAYATRLAQTSRTLIDLGCGNQPYRPYFEDRGIAYRGADFGDAADIQIASDGRIDADNSSTDLVLSFQVLEHVRDLDTYLSEAARVLRPGGKLLLSTHGTWLYHPHPEDHRRWTREGLINELQMRGWSVDSCEAICGPLAWTTILRLTGFCFVLRRIPVVGVPIGWVLSLIMNIRAAIEDFLTPAHITDNNACIYLVQAGFPEE